jgi:hypothetical protein
MRIFGTAFEETESSSLVPTSYNQGIAERHEVEAKRSQKKQLEEAVVELLQEALSDP